MKTSICSQWEFTPEWSREFLDFSAPAEPVRLPHNCREVPQHYADSQSYQMVCGYRRILELPELSGQRVFLRFDGAAHQATLYVNGREAGSHRCGYTAFSREITQLVHPGENRIALKLDTREDPAIPPFGFVVDYLTFGGLYREAWLELTGQHRIEDIFVTTPTTASLKIQVQPDNPPVGALLEAQVLDSRGQLVWQARQPVEEPLFTGEISGVTPWEPENPALYTCRVRLLDSRGQELDSKSAVFGFRTVKFNQEGFFLNGKKRFLRGLNRHQSFPYMGYAAPEHLQQEDARILQEELGCTAVRTSHYPQSHYFLEACDRRGLLVFTELPGWQHIGDDDWKNQALANLEEMILQYRNHPSIVLWGVRINESQDDDPFYSRANDLAHRLDPSRPTSGVRFLEKSHFLEDVYAFNDFSHDGQGPGVRPVGKVSPNPGRGFLISEHNGHMFPTKAFDPWQKRQEQALRHARVLNDAYASGRHAGCFGWCMFDYPTHKDFGSGDRVCYHGVMDAFRNPKPAAALYASQQDAVPVLEVCSSMDIGDYPAGRIGAVAVFSNARQVRLYKNGDYVTTLEPGDFPALPHPPCMVEDTIGELLKTQEGFSPVKARRLRSCLVAAGKYGLSGLPLRYKLAFSYCMLRYRLSFAQGVELYNRYIGNWGGEATCWRFDAVRDGKVVASVTRKPSARLILKAQPSKTCLTEGDRYDMAAIRVRILDENGTPAPYAQLPVSFRVSGPAALVGPAAVTAEGGMCGTYLRTTGKAGGVRLTVTAPGLEPVTLDFTIEKKEDNQ